MKAVVLVGGFGTRLRPLTETIKKELLPLVDRPILDHTLDRLVRHGVEEVVMSSPYLEEAFHPFIEARHGEPRIAWVTEREPLGTGGAIVNTLGEVGDHPFFALNGDICTDLDLTGMRAFHDAHGAAITIALHRVEDARAFGLVETDPDGRVHAFREKPTDAIPGDVNAGTYLIDPAVLGSWTADREISIEREIFPAVIASGAPVFGYVADAYWMDLGTPEKYLQAHFDLLAGHVRGVEYEAPWIAANADVDPDASVGARVAVGSEARIAAGATVEDSVVHPGASIATGAVVRGSIVGPGARIGERATVTDCVLGAGSSVPGGLAIDGVKVPTDGEAVPS
ncbi:MAG: NDP-sugar synthase [Actinomycetota bacterium]|nr:NDP-sugar synthase [Actinomycetota bacterium]